MVKGTKIVSNKVIDFFPEKKEVSNRFKLRFVIKHPTILFSTISETLNLQPHHGHSVGEDKVTLKGKKLEGQWKETFWGYTKEFDGDFYFFDSAVEFCTVLKKHVNFLMSIKDTGGKLGLYVDLIECKNIGDTLNPESMMLFASLGITLGIELFPSE